MAGSADRTEAAKAEERATIRKLVGRVPRGYGDWSYNRSIDYKSAVGNAKKAADSKGSTLEKLKSARAALEGFFTLEELSGVI